MPPDPENGEVPGGDGAFRGQNDFQQKKPGQNGDHPVEFNGFCLPQKQTYIPDAPCIWPNDNISPT